MAIGCTARKKMFYKEMEVVNVVSWGIYIYIINAFLLLKISLTRPLVAHS